MKKRTLDTDRENDKQALTLEAVQRKLDDISRRLARVEKLIERVAPALEDVSESARIIREGFEFYDNVVKLMTRYTRLERLGQRYADIRRDEIAWQIVKVLDSSAPMNISQITAAVRSQRGTASRRIIRQRVEDLLRKGILKLVETDDTRARYFALAAE